MAGYRRFVAYVYEYMQDQKGSNRGFIKVEARNGVCKMGFHLRGICSMQTVPCEVYGFVREGRNCKGVLLGECDLAGEMVEFQLEIKDTLIGGTQYSLNDFAGIIMLGKDGKMYATQWDDNPIRMDEFDFRWNESKASAVTEVIPEDMVPKEVVPDQERNDLQAAEADPEYPDSEYQDTAETDRENGNEEWKMHDSRFQEPEDAESEPQESRNQYEEPEVARSEPLESRNQYEEPQYPDSDMGESKISDTKPDYNETENSVPDDTNTDYKENKSSETGMMESRYQNGGMPGSGYRDTDFEYLERERPESRYLERERPESRYLEGERPESRYLEGERPESRYLEGERPESRYFEGERPGSRYLEGERPDPRYFERDRPYSEYEERERPYSGNQEQRMPYSEFQERERQEDGYQVRGMPNEEYAREEGYQDRAALESRYLNRGMRGSEYEDSKEFGPRDWETDDREMENQEPDMPNQETLQPGMPKQQDLDSNMAMPRYDYRTQYEYSQPQNMGGSGNTTSEVQNQQINESAESNQNQEPALRFLPFPDGDIIECRKVNPRELGMLSRRDHVLANNSFLLHGFNSYNHLLLGKVKDDEDYILGVPGIYDNQEKFMANMFGFPNFKAASTPELAAAQASGNHSCMGQFGYWIRLIDSPNTNSGDGSQ